MSLVASSCRQNRSKTLFGQSFSFVLELKTRPNRSETLFKSFLNTLWKLCLLVPRNWRMNVRRNLPNFREILDPCLILDGSASWPRGEVKWTKFQSLGLVFEIEVRAYNCTTHARERKNKKISLLLLRRSNYCGFSSPPIWTEKFLNLSSLILIFMAFRQWMQTNAGMLTRQSAGWNSWKSLNLFGLKNQLLQMTF